MKKIVYISVDELYPHPDNPRKDLGDLSELSESIKAKGVLQNLTVVPGHRLTREDWSALAAQYKESPAEELRDAMNRRSDDTGYTVVIGHRRLAAAKLAGLTEVPCVVTEMTAQEQFETMMVENVQRNDLTVYEQAEGFQMMLDMGGTMEQVAQKTGFSTTTIRNRVKLLELDPVKFKQAEARGATLTDYLELNKIEDSDLKDSVLEHVGTGNFRNALKQALDKQELRRQIKEKVAFLETFAVRVAKGKTTDLTHVYAFYSWNIKNEFKKPADAGEVKYFFCETPDYGITLYREKVQKVEDEEAQRRAAEEKSQRERLLAEAETITKRHFDLRRDFVRSFTGAKKHADTIMAYAGKALLRASYRYNRMDRALTAELLDLPFDKNSQTQKLDMAAYAEAFDHAPEYALLATAYGSVDTPDMKYWQRVWTQGACVEHDANEALDELYAFLVSLGYEMSDEEKAMQDGTHAIFDTQDEEDDEEDEI